MSAHSAAPPAASADRGAGGQPYLSTGPLARMAAGTLAMAQAEMRKLRHDHLDIITRSVQPLLWLFIFGTALSRNRTLSSGTLDYRAYIAPGVMAQAAMFIAIFYGLSVIWERDVGAAPAPARQGAGVVRTLVRPAAAGGARRAGIGVRWTSRGARTLAC